MNSLALDSLEVRTASGRSRKPLHRTRTLDGSYPTSSSFGRLDKDNSDNESNGLNGVNNTQQPSHTRKKKEKRNISWKDESEWECHSFEPMVTELEQMKEFWVLPDELKEIKKQGFLACREAIRSGLAGLLTEIYGTGNDREVQDRLNYWCRMASSCRGLERFANEELSKRRTIFRKRAIVSVLEAQQQLKNEKGIDTANVLRRLSEAYTEQARAYAAKLGSADYHAIQTVKAPPTNPMEEEQEVAAAASADSAEEDTTDTNNSSKQQNGKRQGGRKSRMERMKERAAATEQKQQSQQQQQNGENGVFRRNNTTMSAVVGLKQ